MLTLRITGRHVEFDVNDLGEKHVQHLKTMLTKENPEYQNRIKKEVEKFQMIKTYGNKNAKNLVIGWGSTKTVILDAIEDLDYKFLQVLYLKPLSDEIEKEIQKAKKVILVEQNVTGQLGRLIREKSGLKIKNRILKYLAFHIIL